MIKNIAIIISTLFLFALLAWTTIAAPTTPTLTPTVSPTPVDYILPYPGILPDNFLYPLKAFRDRLVSLFISDPGKQATFDLLQADKRLAAGEYMLADSHPNTVLISQTISKGENYFSQALVAVVAARNQGQLVNDMLSKLSDASRKHEEVLINMAAKTTGQLHKDLLSEVTRVRGFENQVNKLKPHQ